MSEPAARDSLANQLGHARFFVLVTLFGLLITFAVQNHAVLEVSFLFWTFESRRIVILAITVGIGLIIGRIFEYTQRPKL